MLLTGSAPTPSGWIVTRIRGATGCAVAEVSSDSKTLTLNAGKPTLTLWVGREPALAKDVIELPPTGGLDPEQGRSSSRRRFIGWKTSFLTRPGSLTKRGGFTAMTSGVLDGYSLAPSEMVAKWRRVAEHRSAAEESPTAPGEGVRLSGATAPMHVGAQVWCPVLSAKRLPVFEGKTILMGCPGHRSNRNIEAIARRIGSKAYTRIVTGSTGAVLFNNDELVNSLPVDLRKIAPLPVAVSLLSSGSTAPNRKSNVVQSTRRRWPTPSPRWPHPTAISCGMRFPRLRENGAAWVWMDRM